MGGDPSGGVAARFNIPRMGPISRIVDVLLARQAILDRERKLYGYELLYRSNSSASRFDGTAANVATMQVLSNTLMSIGTENVLRGKKAFVNFDHRLLRDNMHLMLPRNSIVIEILETVEPTADLIALCRSIAGQGYALALDDFTGQPQWEPLTHIARVIKVDVRLSSREHQERMLRVYKPRGVRMLAEKVETHAEFEWARRAGYDLFQGYFFARPVAMRGRQIPAVKAVCLRLLREVYQAEFHFERVEELVREDVALTYKLLRYVNSALFAHRETLDSIGAALVVLGEEGIRRWVSLATLRTLAINKPNELLTLSLTRARFCERLAELLPDAPPHRAFLMGMFSLLDALIDQPLEEALRTVDLGKEITDALLGTASEENPLVPLHELIVSYEQANWDAVMQAAEACGVPVPATALAYVDSARWAEEIIQMTGK